MKPIFALAILVALAVPAHAEEPRKEITVTTKPAPPPPRGCVRTARGDLLPIARSEGDDVDMDACKQPPEEKKVKSIFEVFSE